VLLGSLVGVVWAHDGRVDPDRLGGALRCWGAALEAVGVGREGGGVQGSGAGLQDGRGAAIVDIFRGDEGDAAVAMLGVVPGEEPSTVCSGVLDRAEAFGEVRAILQGLELGLGERVVVADVGVAVGLGHAEVGEQEGDRLGGHAWAAVGVHGELSGGDVVLGAGLGDELLGLRWRTRGWRPSSRPHSG